MLPVYLLSDKTQEQSNKRNMMKNNDNQTEERETNEPSGVHGEKSSVLEAGGGGVGADRGGEGRKLCFIIDLKIFET